MWNKERQKYGTFSVKIIVLTILFQHTKALSALLTIMPHKLSERL